MIGRGLQACRRCCGELPRLPSAARISVRNFAAPSAAKSSPDSGGGGGGGGSFVRTEAGLQDLYMRTLEPKPVAIPPLSAEQLDNQRQLATTYVKLKWKRRVTRDRDLKRKLDLKWAAFHCLPTIERKKEALQINPYVPLYRKIATATPPIHGFHGKPEAAPVAEADAAAAGKAGGKERGSKRPAANESLISAMRGGRGRSGREEEDSLFAVRGPATPKAPEAPKPAAAAPPPPAKGKKGK